MESPASATIKNLLILAIVIAAIVYGLNTFVIKHDTTPPDYSIYQARVEDYLAEAPVTPGPETWMHMGAQAPDFKYATIFNRTVQLSDYIDVKPVVLVFWGSFNRECVEELVELQEFYDRHARDVEIITVSSEQADRSHNLMTTRGRNQLRFIIMHDPTDKIENMYPHETIPFYVFINIDGTVMNTHEGCIDDVDRVILQTFGL